MAGPRYVSDTDAAMKVATQALKVQSARMRVIAENIANAQSTARTPDEDPYRRQIPTFKTQVMREIGGAKSVGMDRITESQQEFSLRYQPGHPAANENGYVKYPNVSILIETMDMRQAQRAYEAGLNVVDTARAMNQRALSLLQR